MENALEPTYNVQPERVFWCDKCGHPMSEEDIRVNLSSSQKLCENCDSSQSMFPSNERNWTYLPLLLVLKYYKWGLPGSIVALGFFFYGILEFLQWLFL